MLGPRLSHYRIVEKIGAGGLGAIDRALEWLEKAYQERNTRLVYLSVASHWDSLRTDPRFQALLCRPPAPACRRQGRASMNFPE